MSKKVGVLLTVLVVALIATTGLYINERINNKEVEVLKNEIEKINSVDVESVVGSRYLNEYGNYEYLTSDYIKYDFNSSFLDEYATYESAISDVSSAILVDFDFINNDSVNYDYQFELDNLLTASYKNIDISTYENISSIVIANINVFFADNVVSKNNGKYIVYEYLNVNLDNGLEYSKEELISLFDFDYDYVLQFVNEKNKEVYDFVDGVENLINLDLVDLFIGSDKSLYISIMGPDNYHHYKIA